MRYSCVLTVQVLLLRSDHLLGGGLADGLGKALASEAVPRRQQSIVYRLSRHTAYDCAFLLQLLLFLTDSSYNSRTAALARLFSITVGLLY